MSKLRSDNGYGKLKNNIGWIFNKARSNAVSHKLTWSHYFELLKIEDELARSFYQNQAVADNWSVRELKRQKQSGLFHRLALSKNKEKILELSRQGQIVKSEVDLIKEPYIFDF